ncbi:hypothetical protein [Streptomyces sp. CB01373]|uniref:hypothetical protein n=1 Tax=Streptomyces sp. CB01373 TaxID=2020325 RepID=UPI000C280298|nr:hypothetical protein [Streptomyces sp. CB01373]PJM92142.1 hypothetical protein CG719_30430 [Streptomyces sp. CB01373]
MADPMTDDTGAVPRHRPRATAPHRTPHTVLRFLAAVVMACLAALGAASSAAAAEGDDLIKVFVVQDPAQSGGQLATLESIAAGTLGDASRAGEILNLNRGLRQKDGGALNAPEEQLHPGWILRLPPDASGPGVQLARETGNANDTSTDPNGAAGDAGAATGGSTVFAIPLAAAVAAVVALLLALVTAIIVSRKKARAVYAAGMRVVRKLGAPARRRRRLMLRRATGRRFAADADSVRRAYGALGELSAGGGRPEAPVHGLRVDDGGVTVWLPSSSAVDAPWQNIDGTRWRRTAAAVGWMTPAGGDGATTSWAAVTAACLVRVGTDTDGEPVFVDLSRLDGVLSVTGDQAVARDVVQNLLAEIARSRPDTPVTVLGGRDGADALALPGALQRLPRVEAPAAAPATGGGTTRAAASRHPVKGLVVLAGTPTERETAELTALCGPGGAGWTGLVSGEVDGAHWRWNTDADGHVDIPVLDVRLTVPA